MDEQIYVAPSNFKRGKLIFGKYHISDLIVLASGTFIMIVGCLLCFNNLNGSLLVIGTVCFILIGGLSWLLTTNYSIYHNILGFMTEYYDFLAGQKVYTYEGVINYDEEKEFRR